jgi:Family of unknown function (DUF5678)
MSLSTFDQIIEAVVALPTEDQTRLRRWLNQNSSNGESPQPAIPLPAIDAIPPITTKRVAPLAPTPDRTLEMEWLQKHRAEYGGQWVALEGNQLIKAGRSAKEVHDFAKSVGIPGPLIVLVEPHDNPPFAGF